MWERNGCVDIKETRKPRERWPPNVVTWVEDYLKHHSCFYLDELQTALKEQFANLKNTSIPTICRALRDDMRLTRKVLAKQARDADIDEIRCYVSKLRHLVTNADQLVFIDETSKDGRAAIRKDGWSKVNTPCVVHLPFSRGKRLSLFAAIDITGFFAWGTTDGTFDRREFHRCMMKDIIYRLNPYPLPRSIVIC